MKRHRAFALCSGIISAQNASRLSQGKPLHTFPDHALVTIRRPRRHVRHIIGVVATWRRAARMTVYLVFAAEMAGGPGPPIHFRKAADPSHMSAVSRLGRARQQARTH